MYVLFTLRLKIKKKCESKYDPEDIGVVLNDGPDMVTKLCDSNYCNMDIDDLLSQLGKVTAHAWFILLCSGHRLQD